MAKKKTAVVDFETYPIEDRPNYPPKPVGVSILLPGDRRAKYWAFGHPTENNCTEDDARRALEAVYKDRNLDLLFHHGKFDLDVAETHWGLAIPPWERCHDTLFIAFLMSPHSRRLGLKEFADEHLGMKPEERDAILDWCVENKLLPKNAKQCGHLIWKAPGRLVGEYANGDVVRTYKIFQKFYGQLLSMGMGEAYDRERRLQPILLRNERDGVRVSLPRLRADADTYVCASAAVEKWVQKRLKAPGLSLDSNDDLAEALIRAGAADENEFALTKTGKLSVSKDSLIGAVTDAKILSVLQYQTRFDTAHRIFGRAWLKQAEETGGVIHPSWNQVLSDENGARTGRMSASRVMNVPKEFEEEEGKFEMPRFKGFATDSGLLPELPNVRLYLLPDRGQVWCKRDYSQQEIRMLGHFENGALMDKYREEVDMDAHTVAALMVVQMYPHFAERYDMKFLRKVMKTIGFGLLYGMGLGALAEKLGLSVKEAGELKKAYLAMFPGLKDLQDELKAIAAADEVFRTWGGRCYTVEPAKWSEKFGRVQTFEYKMINYLIQGSCADATKEAIIRYEAARKDSRFLLTVHDEINFSAPRSAVKSEMKILREVMASLETDVFMLSDGATGPSWGELKDFEEGGWWEKLAA
jgi:DNA polymerase I-like protein with 3'-5' exonuclease and polymerase domains